MDGAWRSKDACAVRSAFSTRAQSARITKTLEPEGVSLPYVTSDGVLEGPINMEARPAPHNNRDRQTPALNKKFQRSHRGALVRVPLWPTVDIKP